MRMNGFYNYTQMRGVKKKKMADLFILFFFGHIFLAIRLKVKIEM